MVNVAGTILGIFLIIDTVLLDMIFFPPDKSMSGLQRSLALHA